MLKKDKLYLPKIFIKQRTENADKLPPEVTTAIDNFQTAKRFHKENLEHKPLPETVPMQKPAQPIVTGIGYKSYNNTDGYAACVTMCRPQTCVPTGCSKQDRHNRRPKTTEKPITVHSIIQKSVAPIELALCWDIIPENRRDEPKRSTHIDGSNGSAAPAVFIKVYSPKPPPDVTNDDNLYEQCNQLEHSRKFLEHQEIKPTKLCNHIEDMKISDNLDQENKVKEGPSRRSSSSTGKDSVSHSNHYCLIKNHPKLHNHKQLYHSSPNLSISGDKIKCNKKPDEKPAPVISFDKHNGMFVRPCAACNLKNTNDTRPKSEYKMAFKAGKPNSCDLSSTAGSVVRRPYVNVPKPRDPYGKRNYRISTLAPPFCLEPEKRVCDYPEHWRLASVYQHSFKPMHARKRPLLASVYQ